MIAPQFGKPYVKSTKNNHNDAEAICEAVTHPNMRFVPIEKSEQQAWQLLHRPKRKDLVLQRILQLLPKTEPMAALEVSDLPVRRVTQSYKNRKIEKLKQEGRKIEYIAFRSPAGCGNTGKTEIPAYYSHEANCNLNGKAVRTINREVKTIWCRHLAYSFVKGAFGRGKASFEALDSINKLANFEGIANQQLLSRTFYRKCPADAYYFTPERFPEALAKIARQHMPLPDKTEKSYLFSATNHQMALRIKKRGDALKIIFYDPNDTLRHKSFILSQPDDANALSIDDFPGPPRNALYFLDKSDSGCCLVSVETSIKRDDSNVYHYGGVNEALFHLSLQWGIMAIKIFHKFPPFRATA